MCIHKSLSLSLCVSVYIYIYIFDSNLQVSVLGLLGYFAAWRLVRMLSLRSERLSTINAAL